MVDVNLFALYNTKTDLSQERRKEGKICKNVLYNFHCSFKGNNKNFRFMSPLIIIQQHFTQLEDALLQF